MSSFVTKISCCYDIDWVIHAVCITMDQLLC